MPFPFAPDDCYNELADLPLGKVRFYNVRGSDATLGAVTLDDASNADSLVVTARYASVYTDKIKITVTANATTSTSRDVKVDVYAPDGTTVMVTNTYAAVQVADGTVTDPSDPYVTFAKKSGNSPSLAAACGISAQIIVQPLRAPMPEITANPAMSLPAHAAPKISSKVTENEAEPSGLCSTSFGTMPKIATKHRM